jgi:hypothetical protein
VPFEREATNGRNLGAHESSERNRPSSTKVNLIHAHPGVALSTISHDAIVAGKGNYGTGGEAVTIDGSDSRDFKAVPVSMGKRVMIGKTLLGKVSRCRRSGSKVAASVERNGRGRNGE